MSDDRGERSPRGDLCAPRRSSRSVRAGLALLCVTLLGLGLVASPSAIGEEQGTFEEVGTLAPTVDRSFTFGGKRYDVPGPMIVDGTHNIGFSVGADRASASTFINIAMYDLEKLSLLEMVQLSPLQASPPVVQGWAIDEARQRIYAPAPSGGQVCGSGAAAPTMKIIDYGPDATGERHLVEKLLPMPCSGMQPFSSLSASYYAPAKKLYLTGRYGKSDPRSTADALFLGTHQNEGDELLVRQLDMSGEAPKLDWEVDLRTAGCGRRVQQFVARVRDTVVSYCNDPRTAVFDLIAGRQGYVVSIPLTGHWPRHTSGSGLVKDPTSGAYVNALIHTTPALPGTVYPIADQDGGRVLLVTADKVNGNAAYLFDPIAERFVGVITGGFGNEPPGNTAVGFDSSRGRAYLLTSRGILSASSRVSPLPGGSLHRVLTNGEGLENFVPNQVIAVAPRLGRLFVPSTRLGTYVVIEDRIVDPLALKLPEPDDLTTQIDEEEGVTAVNASGRMLASGAHVVVTGGVARIASQNDPLCNAPYASLAQAQVERAAFGDGCLAGKVVSTGHRELFLALTDAQVGSSTGAVAEAAGLSVPSSDSATNHDVANVGSCGAGTFAGIAGQSPRDEFKDGCKSFQDGLAAGSGFDPQGGTKGANGEGFPVASSTCYDSGGTPTTASRQGASGRLPTGSEFTSQTGCNADGIDVVASSRSAGFALPSAADPQISVSETFSDVRSARTPEGQVTVSLAGARGVAIGPLRIAEVTSVAITKAKGRTGKAFADHARQWCGIEMNELKAAGCMNPDDPANADSIGSVNQALGRVRISIPPVGKEHTAGGYQAVVTKDPASQASDAAVNDDDSKTVSALELIAYNDGPEGRSRMIVQLGGVHAESRYGIYVPPNWEPTKDDTLPPETTTTTPDPYEPPSDESPFSYVEDFLIQTLPVSLTAPLMQKLPRTERQSGTPLQRVLRAPVEAIRSALTLLINDPVEFALLFAMWSLLAYPMYLALRRRAFLGLLGARAQSTIPSGS